MITNIFSRSNPMNFVVISILLFIAYGLTVLRGYQGDLSFKQTPELLAVFPILLFIAFMVDFISKKNNLNKNNTYSILLFVLFLCLIPDSFTDFKIALSSLFVLFALRKLLALQSLVVPKQKIFDASFWITAAAILQWEAIFFLLLVFVAIIIHVSTDFKNWIIPFVGVFVVVVLFVFYALVFDVGLISEIQSKMQLGFDYQNILSVSTSFSLGAFVIIALSLVLFQLVTIRAYLAIIQNTIKLLLICFLLAFLIFMFSGENKNSLLLYSIAPLSMIGANFISNLNKNWIKEAFVLICFGLAITSLLGII